MAINVSTSKKALKATKNKSGLFLILMTKHPTEKKSLNVEVIFFLDSKSSIAIERYNKAEMDPEIYMAVLLSVSDAKTLKQAYPNYFGSAKTFTDFILKHDSEHKLSYIDKYKLFAAKHELVKKLHKRVETLSLSKIQRLQTITNKMYVGLYDIDI
ncbi:MAG: hypothetical protein GY730_05540 [bacterium]|nr:hypothetical protein [bacterium]